MRTVYSNTHSSSSGFELSGEYRDRTSTRIFCVTASEIGAECDPTSGILIAHDSRSPRAGVERGANTEHSLEAPANPAERVTAAPAAATALFAAPDPAASRRWLP